MPNDEREKLFERALTRHLRHAPSGAACPDAEILAAYHERTLSLEEATHWKLHIAGCSRCQEVLSLLEETGAVARNEWDEKEAAALAGELTAVEITRASARPAVAVAEPTLPGVAPATASAVKKLLPFRTWRWFVPLGAVAAALLVWVGVRETGMTQKSATIEVARNQQPTPQYPASSSGAPKPQERAEPALPLSDRVDKEIISKDEAASVRARQAPSAANQANRQAAGPSALTQQYSQANQGGAFQQKGLPELDSAKSAAPRPAAPVSGGDALAVRKIAPAAAPPPPAPSVSAGKFADNEPENGKKKESVPSTRENVEVNGAVSAVTINSSELKTSTQMYSALDKFSANDRSVITVAGKNRAWRVGPAGRIEFTTDGGKTWKTQQSPVVADLTTGSAPSDKVCWIVGKTGTLLLTRDGGKRWKVVTSPTTDDLGGVHAIDAQHASIWDVLNRRSFQTSDGGVTWTQSANE
jgi:hypothetical protein